MFAVIIRATVGELDDGYTQAITRMKQLAFEEYGCLEFFALMDGEKRIAISYWETEEQIRLWKTNAEHALAQQQGQAKWYASYIIQVVEVKRQYAFNTELPVQSR